MFVFVAFEHLKMRGKIHAETMELQKQYGCSTEMNAGSFPLKIWLRLDPCDWNRKRMQFEIDQKLSEGSVMVIQFDMHWEFEEEVQ